MSPKSIAPHTLFFLLFTLCFVPVFAQTIIPVDTSQVQTIRIDPPNAMGGKATDFLAEVEYIPLETTKESLFGRINQLEVMDDRYYILASRFEYVLIFDKKGKFIKKIGKAGSSIGSFTVNKWTKQLVISGLDGKHINYYDAEGNLLKSLSTDLATVKTKTGWPFYFLSKDKGFAEMALYRIPVSVPEYKTFWGSLITFANEDRTVYARGLQFPSSRTGLEPWHNGLNTYITRGPSDSTYYYAKLFDYEIYTISPNRISLSYKFVVPLNISLPAGFSNDSTLHVTRSEWFDARRELIANVGYFYRINNNLIFSATTNARNDEDMLFYNLNSSNLVAYKHIATDAGNHFLPLYDGSDYSSAYMIASANGSVYTQLSSREMFENYEENKSKKLKYPSHLQQYFSTRSRMDNPVLVRIKLKDNI